MLFVKFLISIIEIKKNFCFMTKNLQKKYKKLDSKIRSSMDDSIVGVKSFVSYSLAVENSPVVRLDK